MLFQGAIDHHFERERIRRRRAAPHMRRGGIAGEVERIADDRMTG